MIFCFLSFYDGALFAQEHFQHIHGQLADGRMVGIEERALIHVLAEGCAGLDGEVQVASTIK